MQNLLWNMMPKMFVFCFLLLSAAQIVLYRADVAATFNFFFFFLEFELFNRKEKKMSEKTSLKTCFLCVVWTV